jgi:dTDP-4-dehydrorhamnose reductase
MSLPVPLHPPLELWGGVECTINRIGDTYSDQLERSGHLGRIEDLDLFAELGIQAIRYPVQWERVAPYGLKEADWSWTDERLGRLRTLGIRPIVGLVHHGSGPRHTSLLDPSFAEGLATFARAVAERYPWIESYTPVNEPLTTARFSGLYGHWYPHGRDNASFLRAVLMQCQAVVLAMHAIRSVNLAAQLVQTEDLGKTFSTPLLAYQAELENERRWLTFDLLCGRFTSAHPLWNYLRRVGIAEEELAWFAEHPCPPDVLGINYYLTSERFLDENLQRYAGEFHGGNGLHAYADVEAVRIDADLAVGHQARLKEAWERYRLPLAITEAHLNCTREEQLRYLLEAWKAAEHLRDDGIPLRAVTTWSLLGAYDWNTLLTCPTGFYEPGAFDVRSPRPRPTAIAHLVHMLAQRRTMNHPFLALPGWWHRPVRFYHPMQSVQESQQTVSRKKRDEPMGRVHPLVITGAAGTLGRAMVRLCELRGLPYRLLTHQEMDIADLPGVISTLKALRPWAVVNAAGYVCVDEAEHDYTACHRANTQGPAVLAAVCHKLNIQLLTFSSDLVFDGKQRRPYVESDPPAPLCIYGRTKAEGEARVCNLCPSALIVRTSAFFGPWDRANFVTRVLKELAAQHTVAAADDLVVSPTYVPDLVHTSLDLLIDRERGVWHLANAGAISWAELACYVADLAHLDACRVERRPASALGFAARRPPYSVLGSERGTLLPSLDDALARYLQECEVKWAA